MAQWKSCPPMHSLADIQFDLFDLSSHHESGFDGIVCQFPEQLVWVFDNVEFRLLHLLVENVGKFQVFCEDSSLVPENV